VDKHHQKTNSINIQDDLNELYLEIFNFQNEIKPWIDELKSNSHSFDEPMVMANKKCIDFLSVNLGRIIDYLLKLKGENYDLFLKESNRIRSDIYLYQNKTKFNNSVIALKFLNPLLVNDSCTSFCGSFYFPVQNFLNNVEVFESISFELINKCAVLKDLVSEVESDESIKMNEVITLIKENDKDDTFFKVEKFVPNIQSISHYSNRLKFQFPLTEISNSILEHIAVGYNNLYENEYPQKVLFNGIQLGEEFRNNFLRLVNFKYYDELKSNYNNSTPCFIKQYSIAIDMLYLKHCQYETNQYLIDLQKSRINFTSSEYNQQIKKFNELKFQLGRLNHLDQKTKIESG
jgi:hypothetical protein